MGVGYELASGIPSLESDAEDVFVECRAGEEQGVGEEIEEDRMEGGAHRTSPGDSVAVGDSDLEVDPRANDLDGDGLEALRTVGGLHSAVRKDRADIIDAEKGDDRDVLARADVRQMMESGGREGLLEGVDVEGVAAEFELSSFIDSDTGRDGRMNAQLAERGSPSVESENESCRVGGLVGVEAKIGVIRSSLFRVGRRADDSQQGGVDVGTLDNERLELEEGGGGRG